LGFAHGSGSFARGGRADGFEEFRAGDGGGAAFHDDQATGNIGEMRGFEGRGAAGEAQCVGGEDSVARAGDVHSLITAVDGNVDGFHAALKESHAVTATGDDEGFEFHLFERGAGHSVRVRRDFFSDSSVVEGFDFTFVGSGRNGGGSVCSR